MGFQIRVILGAPQKWAYIMQTQMFRFSSWLTLFCFINTIARGDRHEERRAFHHQIDAEIDHRQHEIA